MMLDIYLISVWIGILTISNCGYKYEEHEAEVRWFDHYLSRAGLLLLEPPNLCSSLW